MALTDVFLLDFESIVEVFSVQNSFGIVSKLASQELLLLVFVLGTHVRSLVHIGSSATVERTIILVNCVLLVCLRAMEGSHIGPKVGVLAKSCCQTEAFGSSLRGSSVSSFDCSDLCEGRVLAHLGHIVEGLVSLSELPGARWSVA